MTARTDVGGATNFVLQEAIGAYTDEAYTNAKKLSGTGIVSDNPNVNRDTETYVGQLRWFKPMNPTINVASLTDSTAGTTSTYASDYLTYVKTARTYGGTKVNLQQLVTQKDGLAKISRDFVEHRTQDEHNAILAVLKGVALAEALNGAASAGGGTGLGGQTFTNDPTDKKYGFYVDMGASRLINKVGYQADGTTANAAYVGAQRAEGFLEAFGKAYKDHEPEWAYLVTSPEVLASLRSANLVDSDRVRDGNLDFPTIFQGKFRLLQTRAAQGMATADLTKVNTGAGVDIVGTKTSFIVLPGALAMVPLVMPEPVEIDRNAGAYRGGGTTTVWYRWGYILAPAGYNWAGSADKFPSDAEYGYAVESGTAKAITDVTTIANATGTWVRKSNSALSLGILPVFHG
jgi:hypothetical protein